MVALPGSAPKPKVDTRSILRGLADRGLAIIDPSSPERLRAAEQLQSGSISAEEFATSSQSLVVSVDDAISPCIGSLSGLPMDIAAEEEAIKAQAEARVLQRRLLFNLETVRMLAPKLTKIALAVEEAVEAA